METLSKCPVCESGRIRFDYEAPTTRRMDSRMWRVDRCEACSHGFMNPQLSWDELSAYYSALYDPYDPTHGADGSDDQVVARATREGRFRHIAIGKGDRILDVGCGAVTFCGSPHVWARSARALNQARSARARTCLGSVCVHGNFGRLRREHSRPV